VRAAVELAQSSPIGAMQAVPWRSCPEASPGVVVGPVLKHGAWKLPKRFCQGEHCAGRSGRGRNAARSYGCGPAGKAPCRAGFVSRRAASPPKAAYEAPLPIQASSQVSGAAAVAAGSAGSGRRRPLATAADQLRSGRSWPAMGLCWARLKNSEGRQTSAGAMPYSGTAAGRTTVHLAGGGQTVAVRPMRELNVRPCTANSRSPD